MYSWGRGSEGGIQRQALGSELKQLREAPGAGGARTWNQSWCFYHCSHLRTEEVESPGKRVSPGDSVSQDRGK